MNINLSREQISYLLDLLSKSREELATEQSEFPHISAFFGRGFMPYIDQLDSSIQAILKKGLTDT